MARRIATTSTIRWSLVAAASCLVAAARAQPDNVSEMQVLAPIPADVGPGQPQPLPIEGLRADARHLLPNMRGTYWPWETILDHHSQDDRPIRQVRVSVVTQVGEDTPPAQPDLWRFTGRGNAVGVEMRGLHPNDYYVVGCVMQVLPDWHHREGNYDERTPGVEVTGQGSSNDRLWVPLPDARPDYDPISFSVPVLFLADEGGMARVWLHPRGIRRWKWWSCTLGTADEGDPEYYRYHRHHHRHHHWRA